MKPLNDYSFYDFCQQVSCHSTCFSRQIGAIITDQENDVISIGWNGPPNNIPTCDKRQYLDDNIIRLFKENYPRGSYSKCPRKMLGTKSGERLDLCLAIHAEEASILGCFESNRNPKWCKMYLSCGIPCVECLKKIIQVGISEVVVASLDYYDNQSKYLIENSNLKIRLYDFMEKISA